MENSWCKRFKSYLKGNNDAKWWGIGISIMATQASAITFLSTPGQAYTDGMRFIQFYFGLPIAMIILSVTFLPIFYRLKVYTAYEYLETRFDLKTRTLAAFFIFNSKGTGCRNYYLCSFHNSIYFIELESNINQYFYWFVGNSVYSFGNQRRLHKRRNNRWQ